MKILLADDEEELAKAIGMILKFSDYETEIVNDGEQAVEKAIANNYDALILDVMMPKKTGIEVVKELRERNIETPILMLTAKSEVEDKVEGLDVGANDYITKPFNKDELLARLRALTRTNQNKLKKINVGNVIFDREGSKLYNNKISFNLNNKECQMVEVLIGNQDKEIGKDELKNRVWGDEASDKEIVPMYVSYLQNKFQALGANVQIKESNGYRLENLL